jgi:hypothetical protein
MAGVNARYGPMALGLAASLLFPAALAGCAAQSAAAPPSPPSVPTTAPSAAVASSVSSAMATDALSGEHCAKTPGGSWVYTATLANHDTAKEKFTVSVGLTESTAVLGHTVIEKTLNPGESTTVTGAGFGADVPADGVDCGSTVSRERTE